MKWSTTIAAGTALFASAASASPIWGKFWGKHHNHHPKGSFRLRVSSQDVPELDGKYISSTGNNSALTISDSNAFSPVTFYLSAGESHNVYEMHIKPIGIVDHVIGLQGQNGLLSMTDLTSPSQPTFPNGTTTTVWKGWSLASPHGTHYGNGTHHGNGTRHGNGTHYDNSCTDDVPRYQTVDYTGKGVRPSRWIARPKGSDWDVTYYDNTSVITQDYKPISVVWQRVCPDDESEDSQHGGRYYR